MRIIHITNNYHPYGAGVVASIDAIVQEQIKQGHYVRIITLNFLGDQHTDPEYVMRIPSLIRFIYRTNHCAIPWRPQSFLRKAFIMLKPDIVHVHHPFLLGKIAVRVARSMNIATIFTHHTMYEQYVHYVPMPAIFMRSAVLQTVSRFCKKVDGIIVPSSGIKKRLIFEGVTRVEIIPSPLRVSFITTKLSLKRLVKPIRLLTVGRFVTEKNIEVLLEMMTLLSHDYTLTLVGYGAHYAQLQEYAYHALGLSRDRVIFVYKPTQNYLQELYQSAHFFLFSSITDTQGIVLAEAMAHSLPVIALDGIGQRDCIVQGYNGYLVEDAAHMAQMLQNVVHDEGIYHLLQQGAYATAKGYYPEVLGKRLLDYYRFISYQR